MLQRKNTVHLSKSELDELITKYVADYDASIKTSDDVELQYTNSDGVPRVEVTWTSSLPSDAEAAEQLLFEDIDRRNQIRAAGRAAVRSVREKVASEKEGVKPNGAETNPSDT